MKKSHLILLIVTAVMALFSAYSLAAMNQVYKINFEWYSQYNNIYTNEHRDTSLDKWALHGYPKTMRFDIIGSKNELLLYDKNINLSGQAVSKTDFQHSFLINCTLGKVDFPEYRIKIIDIAQRGNVVEVRVSLNSPSKLPDKNISDFEGVQFQYIPQDTVKINIGAFPVKGKLVFIFKNQDGRQIAEKYYEIKGDVIENTFLTT